MGTAQYGGYAAAAVAASVMKRDDGLAAVMHDVVVVVVVENVHPSASVSDREYVLIYRNDSFRLEKVTKLFSTLREERAQVRVTAGHSMGSQLVVRAS